MNILSNISVNKRIFAVIISLIILIAAATSFSLLKIKDITNATDKIYNVNFVGLNAISSLSLESEKQFGLIAKVPSIMDLDQLEVVKKAFNGQSITVDNQINDYLAKSPSEDVVFDLNQIKSLSLKFRKISTQVFEYTESFAQDQAMDVYNDEVDPLTKQIKNILKKLSQRFDVEAKDNIENLIVDSNNFLTTAPIFIVIVVVIIAALSLVISLNISSQLSNLSKLMSKIANHDLSTEIICLDQKDEIGEMARAVEFFKESLIKSDKMAEEQTREHEARLKRSSFIEELTNNFNVEVSEMLDTVNSSASDLKSTAENMSSIAEKTASGSTAVATATEEITASIETVASAATELSASVEEVSNQVVRSTGISDGAKEKAILSQGLVNNLNEKSNKIGDVIQMINDIAEKTNLLALNATIEAARAGDAGKGFAVVANEVKNLAHQTAIATEEISKQIEMVQDETCNAVKSIDEIGAIISEISNASSEIASAVEQQNLSTQEIANNIQQIFEGVREASSNILGVSDGAIETGRSSEDVLGASNGLVNLTKNLEEKVRKFIYDVTKA